MALAQTSQPMSAVSLGGAARRVDKLTLWRLLVLVSGVAFGLWAFGPQPGEFRVGNANDWRVVTASILNGLALPGPLLTLRRRGSRPLDLGGLIWVTMGIGAWLLVPPALAERGGMAPTCLHYVLGLISVWYLLAAIAGGRLDRSAFAPSVPWCERFGLGLAAAWTPLGVWCLYEIYKDAF